MKVKKYTAPTMPEAMNRIRKELGPEAVILNSREIFKGGFLGLFKKRNIEVVAALDPEPKATSKQNEAKPPVNTKQKTQINAQPILNELKQVRKMVELQTVNSHDYPGNYQVIYNDLTQQEIDEDLAKSIMDNVISKQEEENHAAPDQDDVMTDVKREIENRLNALNFESLPKNKKLIQFVGPTGVGKTTTIAKVAASSMINEKKQVALITADTYRIAAIEQLKTYANILNIPLAVVYDLNDYKAAIEKFASCDLILVDTAGRNFLDETYVYDLQKIISFNGHDAETYLVLSLTAKANDIMAIYHQFQHLPIQNVIFTKVDETRQYGSILNIALKNQLGIAFMTNGQDVPDDIIRPSPQMISELIAGEKHVT